MSNQATEMLGSAPDLRIVLFDDSVDAADRLKNLLQNLRGSPSALFVSPTPNLDSSVREAILSFRPTIFIVDLILGDSILDGYGLIQSLQDDPGLSRVPIVVVSKVINSTPPGQAEKKRALGITGVVGAFSKYPNFPDPATLKELAISNQPEAG